MDNNRLPIYVVPAVPIIRAMPGRPAFLGAFHPRSFRPKSIQVQPSPTEYTDVHPEPAAETDILHVISD